MSVYFVSYFIHNKENDGWAYKVVNKYTDSGLALKSFYHESENYVGGEVYDYVTILLTDAAGNTLEKTHWVAPSVEPEPEV